MAGPKQVLKLSWDIADKSKNYNNDNSQTATMTDDKTRIQALALANDCYKYIMDPLLPRDNRNIMIYE